MWFADPEGRFVMLIGRSWQCIVWCSERTCAAELAIALNRVYGY